MSASYDHDYDLDPDDPAEQGTRGDRDMPPEDREERRERWSPSTQHEHMLPDLRYRTTLIKH
jgi:hypothetical protein